MGASTFMVTSKGKDAKTAFNKAVDEAAYECGHGGYTGTIAEKSSFVMIKVPSTTLPMDKKLARTYADKLIDEGDSRVDDKWGPAGCIDLGNGEYLFFGWASC
jgi:hypothetical protein